MDGDALLHPRGPLPAGVYWRRRLVTFGVVVLVLFLLARACGSDGSPTAGVSPSPTASPSPAATRTPRPSKPATAAVTGPCRKADLVVSARADAQAYPGGRRPVLTIGVATRGSAPCTFDVGQANREIRVTSGNDRVWSSDDCSPGGSRQVVTLRPGAAPTSFSVTWSRKRSAPGCPSGTREAAAGTYRVVGRFADILSEPDSFTLG
jgi:hypothetical protein